MTLTQRLKRLGIDAYLVMLFGTVALAVVLPASGAAADAVKVVSLLAVALLFFLYGAKLDTSAVIAGFANLKLQGLVLAFTYVVFPLVALGLVAVLRPWIDPHIAIGLLFIGVLPSTVQSSIAFTALAQGNVAAAVCAASLSNLIGVVLTPILCAVLLQTNGGGINPGAIGSIALQILLPFVLGQLARPWIGKWIAKHKPLTLIVDRGSILLIIYSAFSAGMVAGVWNQVDGMTLALMGAADVVLLAIIAFGTGWAATAFRLNAADRATLLYCGSTKSLASGVPMAAIIFAGQPVSLIILPLMIFHQLQLIVCAIVAQRQANLASEAATVAVEPGRA